MNTRSHFAQRAMGCQFDLWLETDSETLAAQVAVEVWDEIQRLERQLSLYQPDSDLNFVNAHAVREPTRVEPALFQLFQTCKQIWEETAGAFDPAITPLLRLWGFIDKQWQVPAQEEIEKVLAETGMAGVLLEPEGRWVFYALPQIEVSFGAVGKGYAVMQAARLIQEYGVEAALISAGGSTLYGLGAPEESPDGWQVGIRDPRSEGERLDTLWLQNRALSTSGGYEQFFEHEGKRYSHILDPRSGMPARGVLSASVAAPDATLSDALSTAFYVAGKELAGTYQHRHLETKVWFVPDLEANG